jgi:GntR family transcriptional repressor for pyruvate dehydrogenase complex
MVAKSTTKPFEALAPRRTLADEVTEVLRARLVSGEISSGERLPTESQLADAFQVSRAVIREAIARLKHERLVESRQGAGMFRTRAGSEFKSLNDAAQGADARLLSVYELRLAIEPMSASLAAQRWVDETIEPIRAALARLEHAVVTGRGGAEADTAFHRAIGTAAANPLVASLQEFLQEEMRASLTLSHANTRKVEGAAEGVQREHARIGRAIEMRDGARAAAAMARHIRMSATRLSIGALPSGSSLGLK